MKEWVFGIAVNKIFVQLKFYFSKNLTVNENAFLVMIATS